MTAMAAVEPTCAARHAGAILTIDLGAVVANWRFLNARLVGAECAAVVKADAYGLGAPAVVHALSDAGCTTFFVALLDEGIALRSVLPDAEIVALSGLLPGCEADHAHHRVIPVLNSLGDIARWQAFAQATGRRQQAWIHLDTGMNRLGLAANEAARLAAEPQRLDGIAIRGWMSHLAYADQPDHPVTGHQRRRFVGALAHLPAARRSLANSSGLCRNTDLHFDLVRPGAALYGINPTPEMPNPLAPVISLRSRILQVHAVDSGMTIGYGGTHTVARCGRIATIALGYADGWWRSLSGHGCVFIEGWPAPLVGRVSMDLITADVSGVPESLVNPGGWAELIGPQQSVDQVAAEAGTIGYEFLTSLSRRYHRIWLEPTERTCAASAQPI